VIGRRNFLTGAVTLVCAPAVVRFANIMPVRSFLPLVEAGHYCFAERLKVASCVPRIVRMQNVGLSQFEIAIPCMTYGQPWTAENVGGIIRLDQSIRRSDAAWRQVRAQKQSMDGSPGIRGESHGLV